MKTFFLFLLLILPVIAIGQAGTLDTTFNYDAYHGFQNGNGPNGDVACMVQQPDGKIIIGGGFNSIGGQPLGRIARLNADGSIDYTFNPGNTFNGANGTQVKWIFLRSDGKMIVGGDFLYFSGSAMSSVVLINQNGTIDPTFNLTTTGYVQEMAVQADGKLIVGGGIGQITSGAITRNAPCRINQDGTIDPTFDAGTGANNLILGIAVSASGKVALAGNFTSFNGVTCRLIGLNSDGSQDLSFGPVTGIDNNVFSLKYQSNGQLVVGGNFSLINGISKNCIARLNINGSTDMTFLSGTGCNGGVMDIEVLSGDTLILGGGFTTYNGVSSFNRVVKLNPNGQLISAGMAPINVDALVNDVLYTSDNKIIIGGQFSNVNLNPKMRHLKLNADFTPVSGYNIIPSADVIVEDVIEDGFGKILIGGNFYHYNSDIVNGIVRVNMNGTRDTSFQSNIYTTAVNAICQQPDGKILIGGTFTYAGIGLPDRMIRLNYDGSVDPSFNLGTGFNGTIYSIVYQPDGKVLVGGDFVTFNGTSVNRIIRLNSDGSIDNSFVTGNGFDAVVYTIELSQTGKIYVAGSFQNYNGQSTKRLTRLNANGTIDVLFQTGTGFDNTIYTVKELSNGDVIIGGGFGNYNGLANNKLIQLATDGTISSTLMNSLFTTTGAIHSICVQPDGKILIGGYFNYNSSLLELIRLEANGVFDNSFQVPSILNGSINKIFLQSNGSILTCGNYTAVNNINAKYVGRFFNDVQGFSNLSGGFQNIQYPGCSTSGSVTVVGYGGVPPYSFNWSGFSVPTDATQVIAANGAYTCTISDATGYQTTKTLNMFSATSATQVDLKANLICQTFRPGTQTELQLDALNDGCLTSNGTLTVILDTLLDVVSFNPTPDYQNGDTLVYNYTNLYFNSPHFTPSLTVLTSASAQIGDSIKIDILIDPSIGDFNPSDNERNYKFEVINGYDPNYKAVYPLGKCDQKYVEKTDYLTYTAHFQNTGNAEAINIELVDTLDASLDSLTVRIVGNSHSVWMSRTGNVIHFHFDSIMLPDSASNSIGSNGYIVFEVKPKIMSITGDEIVNKVEIYFDYNPPIITNDVTNTVFDGDINMLNCELIIGENNSEELLNVYPNPFFSLVTIEIDSALIGKTLEIMDQHGREVLSKTLDSKSTHVDLTLLESGIYFIQIEQHSLKIVHF